MAYSDTISTTVFNTRKVIDSAVRRCKLTAQQITAEYIDIAKDQLYLLLSSFVNQGVQLWCIEKQIYPLYQGIEGVTLDVGTVDVLNANLRYLQEVTGTETTSSTVYSVEFESETPVTTVGILWSGASTTIALERSDDGASWTTIQTETPVAVSGEWTWYDVDQVISATYFRVRATTGTLNDEQVYFGNMPTQIPLGRMNRDQYTNMSNLSFQNDRPLQYWFDRQIPQPIMHLWPVPNEASTVYQIVLWRQRYIMDVGTLTQEIEVPQRWYEAVVAGLAAKLALEIPEVSIDMIPVLDAKAEKELRIAQMEERDNSPIMIQPNISPYTR